MNDKIKELRDLRDLALTQKYEALIVKQNAEIDYRNKQKIHLEDELEHTERKPRNVR